MGHFAWVKGFVRRLTSKWRAAPPVEVVPYSWDLPFAASHDARGMYAADKAYVIAAQLPETIARTVTHEVIGHHGVRHLLRARWGRFMTGLHAGLDKPCKKLGRLRDKVKRAYVDQKGRSELPPVRFADEVAAAAVEEGTDPWTADYRIPRGAKRRRFVDVLKALRRPRSVKVRFGYADLAAVLRAAAAKLKSGCQRFGQRLRPRPGPNIFRKRKRSDPLRKR